MKQVYTLALLFISYLIIAQPDTEVYVFDLTTTESGVALSNQRNISNNPGYDNQPYFFNDNMVVFASTRSGQTDIAAYNIRDGKMSYINDTGHGSEYSPTKIPGQNAVSAIRLDTTGLQRLYRYDMDTGKDTLLVDKLVIGYHTWINDHTIASFVLGEPATLVVSDLKKGVNLSVDNTIGRSLHSIPNTVNTFSYISKKATPWQIKSLNLDSQKITTIAETVPEAEDMCWLINGTILMAKGNTIYKIDPKKDKDWSVLKTFDDPDLQNITRVAVNETGTLLSVVSEIEQVSPEVIVQQQLEAYNSGDIEAFMATYSDDIKLFRFPNTLMSEGKAPMRQQYGSMFASIKDLNAEIVNRTVIGNKVIDKEKVTANGNVFYAVAIYEVTNGLISRVTFIRE
ncbi:nuclear transport factor 2 family protein [Winogradskyella aurantiaca]|uniref:nuclear transport factor 2 family protein n=1 Tax=Winogradskyella aurantiaca TaxID=2219558 RepID=UPI000E1CAEAB|nr:nuclear transport factor 2 family protein [Winogradskyella aurantiaca]